MYVIKHSMGFFESYVRSNITNNDTQQLTAFKLSNTNTNTNTTPPQP